jgi:hypothetical protein
VKKVLKNILKALKLREELISNRMRALETEQANLIKEFEHVRALVDHYDKLAYDPIEEERRVTQALTKPKTRYIPNRKGQSKYKEMFEAIFTDNKSHSFTTIKKMLEDLSGESMNPGRAHTAIQWAVDNELIKKVARGLYQRKDG